MLTCNLIPYTKNFLVIIFIQFIIYSMKSRTYAFFNPFNSYNRQDNDIIYTLALDKAGANR